MKDLTRNKKNRIHFKTLERETGYGLAKVISKSSQDLIQEGNKALEKGKLIDAVNYYEKASYKRGIEKVRDIYTEKGDFFTAQKIDGLLKNIKE